MMSTAEQQNAPKKPQWMEAGMINAYEANYKSKQSAKQQAKQPGGAKKEERTSK